ncbi:MAG: hypothetical protein FJY77_05090 [Candidatus Altiarchaeales archaeon]|nr:hypothetical protein [Candidatus Altiarchaeales archaeon]
MAEDVGEDIRKYIESHNVCTLAVADGKNPSAHTVYYASDGLRVYFESNSHSDKIRILKANPKICLTIDEDYKNWHKIKGIQLFGRARVVESKSAPKLDSLFRKKFPHLNELGGIPENHVFVEVTPEKIYFLDFEKQLGHKSVYYPKELGQGLLSKINW